MRIVVPLAIVIASMMFSTVAFSRLSGRHGNAEALQASADRLAEFPEQIGPWRMVDAQELSAGVQRMLECAGAFNRTYVHDETGQQVNLAVIVGPPGPTAVHSPEICYSSRDYSIEEERTRMSLPGSADSSDEFWRLKLKSNGLSGERLIVYYAWSTGEHWIAPDSARFRFGGEPALFKLQLSGIQPFETSEEDPGHSFLNALANSDFNFSY